MTSKPPKIANELQPAPGSAARWVHEIACAECRVCSIDGRILPPDLTDFTERILRAHGVSTEEARIVAANLVSADERGIPSHGVARLPRYLKGIKERWIRPGVAMTVTEPAPAIGLVDAHNGLGQVAGDLGMRLAIEKASGHGVGVVTVKNSNHYGIAGYYALMAVDAGMIGISLTNSAPLVVPTFGVELMLGTNPISLGAPAAHHPPFLLDMATSVVPRGKLEVYDRNQQQMPAGWAIDEDGFDCQNPGQVLRNLIERRGGGILPLGGRGEEFSGYKGYGLAFLVDILSGVLSGAAYGPEVDDVHGNPGAGETVFPNVGHFFVAFDVRRFMPLTQFEARLDDLMARLAASQKATNEPTIYIHGEKEHAKTLVHREVGIPLAHNVYQTLCKLADAVHVAPPPLQAATEPCRHAQEGERRDH